MTASIHNLENIKALIQEQGFYYIDGFLTEPEFHRCSKLALAAWDHRSNWFLRLNNGQKTYKIHYDNNLVTERFYKEFISNINVNTDKSKLTFWYYAIHHSDLIVNYDNERASFLTIQNTLLADKYHYIFQRLIDSWRTESFFLTCFDKFSFISKHNDVGGNSDGKYKLTMILYLTPDITESDGGHLVFHNPFGELKIWPKANRLVLFQPSSRTIHEVRPIVHNCNIPRLAISGWLI